MYKFLLKGQLYCKIYGTLHKLTDVSKFHNLGWKHEVDLEKGVEMIYETYLKS